MKKSVVEVSKINNFKSLHSSVCMKQSDAKTDAYTRQKYLLAGFLFPIRGYKDSLNRYFYVMTVEEMSVKKSCFSRESRVRK